jgi:hypothetical protein
MPDRRFDVASTVDKVEDSYVISLPTVNYNVAAGIDTPQAFADVVTAPAKIWIF